MLPIRWEPFRDLSTLHKEIDELFRRTFGSFGEMEVEGTRRLTPKVNTFVREGVYHLEAELPGIDRSDLDVNIDGNVLTLRAERKSSKEVKEDEYLVKESHFGSFMRRMTLPEGVDTEKVHAAYDNGILRITMPVSKRLVGGRKVMIEGGAGPSGGKKVH